MVFRELQVWFSKNTSSSLFLWLIITKLKHMQDAGAHCLDATNKMNCSFCSVKQFEALNLDKLEHVSKLVNDRGKQENMIFYQIFTSTGQTHDTVNV